MDTAVPTVSVVIPTYNGFHFIARAIESVLSQTQPVLEIIVVDDGSTDLTVDVVRKYPIRLVAKANGGPGSARNAGIEVSSGEWVAFLDHDDSWHPAKNETQCKFISDHVSAIFCEKSINSDNLGFQDFFWCNLGGNPSGMMIRRSVLNALNGFDGDKRLMGVDDYDFWLRFIAAGYKYKTTSTLYNFTPAPYHYGSNVDKMLDAEIAMFEKVLTYSTISMRQFRRRVMGLRIEAIRYYFYMNDCASARRVIAKYGFSFKSRWFWVPYLPEWVLGLIRAVRRTARRFINMR